jgi:hypothetical protein
VDDVGSDVVHYSRPGHVGRVETDEGKMKFDKAWLLVATAVIFFAILIYKVTCHDNCDRGCQDRCFARHYCPYQEGK